MIAAGAGRTACAPPGDFTLPPPLPEVGAGAGCGQCGRPPSRLSMCSCWEDLPIIHLARKILGREDHRQGQHHEFNIGKGHVCPCCLLLRILHHGNVSGDAVCLHIVLHHVCVEGEHVNRIEPPAVGIKEGHDFDGCDLCIEGLCILAIIVPYLIGNIMKEFSNTACGHLVTGVVVEVGFMGPLCAHVGDCCGIDGNIFILEGEANGPEELGIAMVGFVFDGVREDGHEGVYSLQQVIWDDHEEGEDGFPDCKQAMV